jgi:hypothetical protein
MEHIDAYEGLPKWKHPTAGLGSGHLMLDLKDEVDLRFVWDVLTDFMQAKAGRPPSEFSSTFPAPTCPPCLIYMTSIGDDATLLNAMFGSFGRLPQAGFGVQKLEIGRGQQIRLIDLASSDLAPDIGDLIEGGGVTLVRGAEHIAEPRPDLALEFRFKPPRRQPKGRQYLWNVYVSSFSALAGHLTTALSPRWWSMHDAYEAVRIARKQPTSK